MNESDQINALLVKVMLQEATDSEKKEVEQWLSSHDENRQHYAHFQLIWQQSIKLNESSSVDENAAWSRFKKRTAHQQKVIDHPAKLRLTWLKVAAVFIVFLSAVVLLLVNKSTVPEYITLSSGEKTLADTLPDGSVVHLNKHSSLTYLTDFAEGKQRTLTLEGEAFFEVAKDPEKPFIISANYATVTVLGTSFNVKTTAKATEVIVETGLVEVKSQQQKMKVAPNEMVIIPVGTAPLIKKVKPNNLYNYYFTHTLICHETPVPELVKNLMEAYEKTIIIENKALMDRKINTVINLQKPLDENLSIVSQTLGFTTYTVNDTIFLK